MKKYLVLIVLLTLAACVGVPDKVTPVQEFQLDRYLGKWYEIARLDHSFERGLEKVTAEYSAGDDGEVRVLNRGYSEKEGEWEQAEGKAEFVGPKDEGHLKVSFFGPFYSSYVVFELDENYEYAFVSGKDTSYLWLLARSPTVSRDVIEKFKRRSQELGFNTNDLIFVEHN